ncbi:MAG: protein containing C-terminal region/beta chain of methionyl-tRNA synthetase [Bacteroidetes bacterium]|nr:protein containing C-terminal region/beta chain of methionyl-tRNA synthetase [Bacteroidota bacterium]
MSEWKRYTITAALPYANGPVHIGHLAGCYLPADIYVRYLRANKKDVIFICGSDEHGVPITISARREGVTPQQVVDKYHKMMGDSFKEFGINFSIYSRTSGAVHKETAQAFFRKLYDEGKFIEQETDQYYDEEVKQFIADRYIVGTCPVCGNENAYGDQCENCGSSLSPTDLINPHSTLSGSKPVLRKTRNWFLPLDKLQPHILKYLEQHKDWKSNVYGQCMSWLQTGDGLQPRSMTRDLDWGVPVPVEGATGKVLYVWFDAPIGYISTTKELLPDTWETYWKEKDTRLIHFIGKDNIVFHCIIFPAMLMEHGEFIVADNVPANEFLNLEGRKLSTSKNYAVWLHEYLEAFKDKQDELRYVLASIAPETKDSEFTWKDYQTRVNSELVGIFGNLVNRVLVLTNKDFENKVPQGRDNSALQAFISGQKDKITDAMENFRFREALTEMMNLARHGNQLLSEKEPWKTIKTDRDLTAAILYDGLQIIANLAIMCEPFLPFTSKKIFDMLQLDATSMAWADAGKTDLLKTGHQLGKASLLYQKIEDEPIAAQIEKLYATIDKQTADKESAKKEKMSEQKIAEAAAPKGEITFEDFAKIDLRVGTILTAEKVEKADKLLKLTVDMGYEVRTIVSGIAEHFKPEDIIGLQVSVVANLAPRKLRGIESKGMILLAEDESGKLIFVTPKEPIANGSIVK